MLDCDVELTGELFGLVISEHQVQVVDRDGVALRVGAIGIDRGSGSRGIGDVEIVHRAPTFRGMPLFRVRMALGGRSTFPPRPSINPISEALQGTGRRMQSVPRSRQEK